MKLKFFWGLMLAVALFVAPAFAESDKDGGEQATIAKTMEMTYNTVVLLEGAIEKSLGDNIYEFKDDSGSGNVRIEVKDKDGAMPMVGEKVKMRGMVADHHTIDNNVRIEVREFEKTAK